MSAAEGRADAASAKRIAYLGPSSVLATWSSPVAWIVGFAEEGDIRSLFEQVLSLPQRHVRPTLRSGKSTFFGLEPQVDGSVI